MKFVLYILLLATMSLMLVSCSAARTMAKASINPSTTIEQSSGAIVMIHPDTLDELEYDKGLEDITLSVVDSLKNTLKSEDYSTANGIKVVISILEYENPEIISESGKSFIESEVFFYNSSNQLMSTLHVQALNKMDIFEGYYGEESKNALVEEIFKYMKKNYLL